MFFFIFCQLCQLCYCIYRACLKLKNIFEQFFNGAWDKKKKDWNEIQYFDVRAVLHSCNALQCFYREWTQQPITLFLKANWHICHFAFSFAKLYPFRNSSQMNFSIVHEQTDSSLINFIVIELFTCPCILSGSKYLHNLNISWPLRIWQMQETTQWDHW